MNLFRLALLSALAMAASLSQANDTKVGGITIGHAFARSTVPGQKAGGAYLTLNNQGAADRLVGARTDRAASVELHTMGMDGDVMRMREIDAIDLPSGKVVELKSGGLHLMLMGLKEPLKVGERFPLTLKFEKAGEVKVDVSVERAASPATGAAPSMHRH